MFCCNVLSHLKCTRANRLYTHTLLYIALPLIIPQNKSFSPKHLEVSRIIHIFATVSEEKFWSNALAIISRLAKKPEKLFWNKTRIIREGIAF